jgi:hypothetical protein
MVEREDASFVAECFWPGVVADVARGGLHVRYLGSILMAEDEVVLCQFEGTAAAVREAAERAQIPFERIVEAFRPSTQTADRD